MCYSYIPYKQIPYSLSLATTCKKQKQAQTDISDSVSIGPFYDQSIKKKKKKRNKENCLLRKETLQSSALVEYCTAKIVNMVTKTVT